MGSDSNVLLLGPTGSGKTRLARSIHESGPRRHKPFMTINLASIHEGTLESELFGHERGSFTGAATKRIGRLESANGGTVLLDEIGELSPRLQARLLEFLNSRTLTPVGGNREVLLDLRVIAATHRDLPAMVRRGEFREDLFHRLRVVSIRLSSLAERIEDFDQLIHSCLEEVCEKTRRRVLKISEPVVECFERHPWPGNFRELRNVLEYAVLSCSDGEIRLHDLPEWFVKSQDNGPASASPGLGVAEVHLSLDYQESLSEFEREYLRRALGRHRGRINQTARKIGLSKTTLLRRIRAYGLGDSST